MSTTKITRALALGAALFALPLAAQATEIWSSGPNDITFTKATGADPTLAANQDRITPDVAITRGDIMGIYNAITETAFNVENGDIGVDNVSPEGTEWAFSGLNGNPIFDYGAGAANHATLNFADWETAAGGGGFPDSLTNNAAVVYLVNDDIYLDLQFTSWGVGRGANGQNGFSYIRAVSPTAVPEPASASLLAVTALGMLACRRRRRESGKGVELKNGE